MTDLRPVVGGDRGTWGSKLLSWLGVSINNDGTLKQSAVQNALGGSLSPIFNVKTLYGAAGDGVTDDTTAIQNALTAAAVSGGIVYFPAGTYIIKAILTVQSHVYVVGAGRGVTILDIQTDHSATGRYLGIGANGGSVATKAGAKDLTIICSNASARNQAYGMISVWGGSDIVLEDIEVLSGEGIGIWTGTPSVSTTTGVHRLWLVRPRVSGTYADGIHLSRAAQDCWIIDPYVDTVGDDGIALNSIQTDDGVHNYDQIARVHIVNPTIRDITGPTGSAIALNGCLGCDINGGGAYNIVTAGGNSFGLVINTTGGGNGSATYTATGNRATGFRANACKNGIQIGAATDTDLTGCEAVGSVGTGGYGVGLFGSTNTHVYGGKYTGNGAGGSGYGVFGSSSNTGCHVIGADLRQNVTGPASTDAGVLFDPSCVTT